MKFLLRSLLTLSVAVVLGVGLYYAVQAFPDDSPNGSRPKPGISSIRDDNGSEDQTFRPGPNRRESFRAFRPWTFRKVAGRVLMFSVIAAVAVIGHKLVGRKGRSRSLN